MAPGASESTGNARGLLVLMGGDEFRPPCREMDQLLLEATGSRRPHVVILPTAAAQQSPALAAKNGVEYFQSLGARASPCLILSRADAEDGRLLRPLDSADIIYLTGGDPRYLLEALRATPAWEAIARGYRAGVMVVGSSAGAMVLAEKMRGAGSAWTEALGLAAGLAVLPHAESWNGEQIASLRDSLDAKVALLGIDTATCCATVGDGRWRVLGAGRVAVYARGEASAHRSGERFSLT